jgi:hypothetical protein
MGWMCGVGCVAGLAMVAGSRVGLRGIGPALAGKLAGVWAFALRARGEGDRFQCSLRPDPAAAGACVVGGYLPVPFWADAWVSVVANWLRFLGVRLGCGSGDGGWVVGQGSAGSVLRSQGSSREHGLSRCARGMRVIASNARSGPIPLPPVRAWWVAICRSFGIGRLGLRFVAGWRFLGAGPAGEALSRAPQIEFGRSTT